MSEVVCRLQTELDGPIAEVRDENFCLLGEIEIGVRALIPGYAEFDPGAGAQIQTETEALDDGGFRLALESWAGATPLVAPPNEDVLLLYSSASTSVEWTVWVETPGPIRPGIIRVNGFYDFTAGLDSDAELEFSVDGHIIPGPHTSSWWPFNVDYEVTLGKPFPLLLRSSALYVGDSMSGSAPGIIDLGADLYAFELDETPVPLTETPEPGSLALMGGGLVLLFVRLRSRG